MTTPDAAVPSANDSGSGDSGRSGGSPARQLLFVAGCVVAGALLAIPAAAAWVALADPPSAPVTRAGVYFGELELDQETTVTMWFMVVGLVGGALAGLVVGWLGQRYGWVTIVAVLLLCLVASGLSAFLGQHVFGPDEQAQVNDARLGDLITSEVSLGTYVAYLSWPVGGLIGAIAAIFSWQKLETSGAVHPSSSSVISGSVHS